MTRISTLQDNKSSAVNVTEVPCPLTHIVKKRSTVLVVVTWQSSGAANSVSISGVAQVPSVIANPSLRVPLPYIPLTGSFQASSTVPVWAGPSGNNISMAAFTVKGSDMRTVQGSNYPSNLVVQFSGTVGRGTVKVSEFANFPAFNYRDIQVQTVTNQTASALTFSTTERPHSLDIVGMALGTSSWRTINTPWPGGDSRYMGTPAFASSQANLSPWNMRMLVSMAHLAGGVSDAGDTLAQRLLNKTYSSLPALFPSAPYAMAWGPLSDFEPPDVGEVVEKCTIISNWVSAIFTGDLRNGVDPAILSDYFGLGTASQPLDSVLVLGRAFLSQPITTASLNGAGPPITEWYFVEDLLPSDIPIGTSEGPSANSAGLPLVNGVLNGINQARTALGLPLLSREFYILDLAGKSGYPDADLEAVVDFMENFLNSVPSAVGSAIEDDSIVEYVP